LSAALANTIDTGASYELELETVHKDKKNGWMWALGRASRNDKGVIVSVNGVAQDITERKEAEEKIRHLAMTDHLTGLANRTQFTLRFQQSMKLANREELSLALMVLDLDKFKPVNDTFGHPTGDAALQSVASILNRFTRETDVVARLGGDEFAILFVNPKDKTSVGKNAQTIINEVNKPITIMGNTIQLGISIGIAFYPQDAPTQVDLFKVADAALYKAKVGGRGIFAFYHSDKNI
jgi:diguanylate cyclase (GGDEF)-like protein